MDTIMCPTLNIHNMDFFLFFIIALLLFPCSSYHVLAKTILSIVECTLELWGLPLTAVSHCHRVPVHYYRKIRNFAG